MNDRAFLLKTTRILRYATIALIVLALASLALPYFTYSGIAKKEVWSTVSIFGYLFFPTNFPQMEVLMDVKYLNVATLGTTIVMIVTGIISIIVCIRKRGIATSLFPLICTIFSLVGYLFTNKFLSFCNHPVSRIITIVLLFLAFIVTVVNLVLYIKEFTSRTADDAYLPTMQ